MGKRKFSGHLLGLFLILPACGQGPSFLELQSQDEKSSDGRKGEVSDYGDRGPDGRDPEGEGAYDGPSDLAFEELGNEILAPNAGGTESFEDVMDDDASDNVPGSGGPVDPGEYDIPDADQDDVEALHNCIAAWGRLPFPQQISNYRKIYASVTVGGIGNAINDTENTTEPELILISAGVNVGGSPVYNLMNRNGYYCIKVNVNVSTNLTINLHCNARLADSRVNVNVGSNQNNTTSGVGVHVLSTVQVETMRPSGDACVR